MTTLRSSLRAALCAFAIGLVAARAHAAELRIALPSAPTDEPAALLLDAPDDWRSRVMQPGAGLPTLIEFTPKAGGSFKVLLTLLPARPDAPPLSREAVIASTTRAAAKAAERSIEPAPLAITPLQGPSVYGSYFSATDRQPEPRGFRHLTQGTVVLGALPMAFTVLANEVAADSAQAVERAALQMLRSARRTP